MGLDVPREVFDEEGEALLCSSGYISLLIDERRTHVVDRFNECTARPWFATRRFEGFFRDFLKE